MPVLLDPRRERFANLCAKGMSATEAYVRAGFRRNTGNASTFRKNPEIIKRIDEIILQTQNKSEQNMEDFIRDEGLDQAKIIKLLFETALAAKEDRKFSTAAEALKDIGRELYGMFLDKKQLTIDSRNNANLQPSSAINIEGLNQALEGFGNPSPDFLEIEGVAERVDFPGIEFSGEHFEPSKRAE